MRYVLVVQLSHGRYRYSAMARTRAVHIQLCNQALLSKATCATCLPVQLSRGSCRCSTTAALAYRAGTLRVTPRYAIPQPHLQVQSRTRFLHMQSRSRTAGAVARKGFFTCSCATGALAEGLHALRAVAQLSLWHGRDPCTPDGHTTCDTTARCMLVATSLSRSSAKQRQARCARLPLPSPTILQRRCYKRCYVVYAPRDTRHVVNIHAPR